MQHPRFHSSKWWSELTSQERTRVIIILLAVAGVAIAAASAYNNGQFEWRGLLSNLGTGLVGSVITFLLIDRAIGSKREQESKEEDVSQLKEQLIKHLGSTINSVAISASEDLRNRGWLTSGAVRDTYLKDANLEKADLEKADLQGVDLRFAKLNEANLTEADLRKAALGGADFRRLSANAPRAATLWYAKLQNTKLNSTHLQGVNFGGTDLTGADLEAAEIDDETSFVGATLPNGKKWDDRTDMGYFTNRNFPGSWWRSDDPDSPAYRGKG